MARPWGRGREKVRRFGVGLLDQKSEYRSDEGHRVTRVHRPAFQPLLQVPLLAPGGGTCGVQGQHIGHEVQEMFELTDGEHRGGRGYHARGVPAVKGGQQIDYHVPAEHPQTGQKHAAGGGVRSVRGVGGWVLGVWVWREGERARARVRVRVRVTGVRIVDWECERERDQG